jgi:hypothetical protein
MPKLEEFVGQPGCALYHCRDAEPAISTNLAGPVQHCAAVEFMYFG